MADRRWNILLVEDDEDDYVLTRTMLQEARGGVYVLDWRSSYDSGKQAILSNGYDAVLMDYELGPRTGVELTREVTALGCKAPIILLTGRGNYDIDVEAMQVGATDYLSKGEATPSILERAIRYAVSQKQTEEALRAAKEELELRVQERTSEITAKNITLQAEITERKRIEAELAEMQRRLIDRAETERRELAGDLHDGPMQELYGVIFQLETMASDFSAGNGVRAVADIKAKVLEIVGSLRAMSRELRPPALTPYGLEKAIRSHIDSVQQSQPQLRIHLQLEPDGQRLPEAVRIALFRIYQTAIANVIRHARASEAQVRFLLEDGQARLEIEDNGCGFQVPSRWIELARQGHLGLVGALERAEAAGGNLIVDSKPGAGTVIRVIVPRSPEQG